MNKFAGPAARKQLPVFFAVFIGAALGVLVCGLALLVIDPSLREFIAEGPLALRSALARSMPSPGASQLAPTLIGPSPTIASPSATASVPARAPTGAPTLQAGVTPLAPTVGLRGVKHDYQRWNNCGPTTLEMDLGYFGRKDTQAEIAALVKPNPEDHNVRPDELLAYAKRVGMLGIVRENGTLDQLKLLLSNGMPVIVETSLMYQSEGWIGHYRLLVGYDARQFVAMDSLNGPNVQVKFADLDAGWRAFNRLYLIVYSEADSARVRAILGDALDDRAMYTQAVARARAEVEANPKDPFAQFNLGTSLVGLKRFDEAAAAFDRARASGLPWRMMWYQFGPFESYLGSGRYADVIALADSLLRATDDLEEAHYYKGLALRALGREADARREFDSALRNNVNNAAARRALDSP